MPARRLVLHSIALTAAALALADAEAAPSIDVLSPARSGLVAPSHSIAVEVAAAGLRSVRVTAAGRVHEGVRSGASFVAWQLPLRAGDNKLLVRAQREDGRTLSTAVVVRGETTTRTLDLDATPAFVEGERGTSELRLRTAIAPERLGEILVDADGDGAVDHRGPYAAAPSATYDTPGHYAARIAVRDEETGLLLCTRVSPASRVRVVPPSERVTDAGFAGIGPDVRDLAYDRFSRRVYALSSKDKRVRSYRSDGTVAEEIVLPEVHDPRGIALDRHGNLFVADAGAHRILKLIAAERWAPDKALGNGRGTFGLRGNELGMLQAPVDVGIEPEGKEPRIVVCDTGNDRIQLFTTRGVFDRVIDGAGTPEGRLGAPQSVAVTPDGKIVVADRGNSLIRVFHVSGRQELAFGGAGDTPGRFRRVAKITLDQPTRGFVVADPGNLRVHLFDGSGGLRRMQPVASPGSEAAVFDRAPLGSRWIMARSGSAALDVLRVHDDPRGQGPLDTARAFLEALRSGDTRTAQKHVLARRHGRLLRDLAVPAGRKRLETLASAVETLELVRVPDADAAVTQVSVESNGAAKAVELHLIRSVRTGAWQVLEY